MKKNINNLFILSFLLMIFTAKAQTKPMKLIKPNYIEKGDTIAIVAPSGILKNKEKVIEKAKKLLENWGLKVVYGKNLFNQNNHFAGTDDERAADFQQALDNPNVKAIWCARGGYGSVRILDKLDFSKFIKNPKWIIGYSDITVFHNYVHILGIESLHALMATSLREKPEDITETIETFRKALFGEKLKYTILSSEYNQKGKAKGQLVGGNLTLLMTMLGSDNSISTDGKILFIEEIGEYKYHIDRMLQSLKRAGYFKNLKGIIVGGITDIKKNSTSWGEPIEKLILNHIDNPNIPVLFDFPSGHNKNNQALILGRIIELKIENEQSVVRFRS